MKLRTENISIGYKSELLTQVSVGLQDGMCIALMGVNGAGKSSLLRTLCGLHKPFSGNIFLDTKKISFPPGVNYTSLFSLVRPNPEYPGLCTVREFVLAGKLGKLNWRGLHDFEDETRLQYAMELTGITALHDRYMHTLSDGERQKAGISRAVLSDSPFLLLDEPVSFLDIPGKKEIMQMIREIARAGKIVVYSSHDPDSCFLYSTHLWLIRNKQVEHGSSAEMTTVACSYFGL